MISVCMATFNGEKFIEEQLFSIFSQDMQPSEVVIVDDCSSDNTVKIIKSFIETKKLGESWKVIVNSENKGYPLNFYYAISLCKSELIFFCDQDDIWVDDKIEKMVDIMKKQPNIQVLSCNHALMDKSGRKIYSLMAPKKSNTHLLKKVNLSDVLYKYQWPGMTMAVRKDFFYECLDKRGLSAVPHDFALAVAAADNDAFFFYDYVGVYHRRHENNVGREEHKISKLLNKTKKLEDTLNYISMISKVLDSTLQLSLDSIVKIEEKRILMMLRLEGIRDNDLKKITSLYLKNFRKVRLKSFISDVLTIKKT